MLGVQKISEAAALWSRRLPIQGARHPTSVAECFSSASSWFSMSPAIIAPAGNS